MNKTALNFYVFRFLSGSIEGNEGSAIGSGVSQVAISDVLVVCSALSSFRDALDEAVYEEIDYLETPKKVDLRSSPGVCPCLALLGYLVVSQVFSASVDPTSIPGSERQLPHRLQDEPLQSPYEL